MFDLNRGALAAVSEELTIVSPSVTGELPAELTGTLMRNGPNPFDGRFSGADMLAWWVGPAMVHGIDFRDGRARWYRNRWVRTGTWHRHRDPDHEADSLWDHNPNVNLISHGGRLLTLGEGGMPFVVSRELETVGPTTFGDALTGATGPTGMTAHPKIDPVTGALVYFRADWQLPYLRYGVLDADSTMVVDQAIDLPRAVMMHDFAITETRTLFLDLSVGFDFAMLRHGAAMPLRWLEKPARIGVMARSGGPVAWVEIERCFIQHVVNAYDHDAQTIVFEAVRYPVFLDFDVDTGGYRPNPLGTLWRFTLHIDPASGSISVDEQPLDDRFIELPRIDERQIGRAHRFTYAVEQPTDSEMRGLVKYDSHTDTSERMVIPSGDQNSEPIFVPRQDSAAPRGDDGWLLACVYRQATDTTDVIVADASDLTAEPVATVHLPCRVPAGFHGAWVPSES